MYVYNENISIKIINSNYQTVITKSRNSIKHRIIKHSFKATDCWMSWHNT